MTKFRDRKTDKNNYKKIIINLNYLDEIIIKIN